MLGLIMCTRTGAGVATCGRVRNCCNTALRTNLAGAVDTDSGGWEQELDSEYEEDLVGNKSESPARDWRPTNLEDLGESSVAEEGQDVQPGRLWYLHREG